MGESFQFLDGFSFKLLMEKRCSGFREWGTKQNVIVEIRAMAQRFILQHMPMQPDDLF